MQRICDDLTDEHSELDAVLDGLTEDEWNRATPAAGWAIRDQVSHLWFFDQRALLALTDADGFATDLRMLMSSGGVDRSVEPGRAMSGRELLERWRHDRHRLVEHARGVDPASRVPWYGPAMGARSFLTARLMETWAHGQDVVDALGLVRRPTERLRHVAHIGVRARPFSYAVNRREMPEADVTVVLRSPAGDWWQWGGSPTDRVEGGSPTDRVEGGSPTDRVEGDALDFCLVVTQRRHLADTELRVVGNAAAEWMSIAQAFAGGAGGGRAAGQFPKQT